ncbi:MAG TPA: YjjG family noncanonical pyrimidine nucleotidase [Bacteroidales bacterium]|nr:YjjG family noncanonical pyrimidine nucleotidase [Bacteroidales bacterium]
MSYKHVFFDLDRTLYDFDKSTRITFLELYKKFRLKENGVDSFEDFLELYKKNNVAMWERYRNGEITKKFLNVERFFVTLLQYRINDRAFAGRFAADYIRLSPQNEALYPNVHEVLSYLRGKYTLHIITNGFEEVQGVKMKSNNLDDYFKTVTTSEEAGAKKPNPKIFNYALKKAGATAAESIMIGDDYEVDILGAKEVGLDQILFAPNGSVENPDCTHRIKDLLEIKSIL